MDHFVRERGAGPMLPYLKYFSDEALILTIAVPWDEVTVDQRALVIDELRRRHPDFVDHGMRTT